MKKQTAIAKQPAITNYDKRQAALYLEKSERAIERYTKQGLLHPRQIDLAGPDGRARPTNVYDVRELDALKAGLTAMSDSTGHTQPGALQALTRQPDSRAVTAPKLEASPQLVELIRAVASATGEGLLAALEASRRSEPPAAPPAPAAESDALRTYTLREASEITRLSEKFLAAEARAGRLKARKHGRWVVTHNNLKKFIDKF